MNWESLYLACFCIGLALSVLSFASGFGHFHAGHLHLGHSHAGHAPSNVASPFNLFTLMTFLCWFGGAGYLLSHYRVSIVPVVFAMASVSGIAGAALVFSFLVKVLLPHEKVMLPEDTEMRGVVARVSSPLSSGSLGEILFSLEGSRRSMAARSEDGQPISRETQVLVTRYEQGIAWVRPFTELDELDGPHTPI